MNRLAIKLGTKELSRRYIVLPTGSWKDYMLEITRQITHLREQGKRVVHVTSGSEY